MLRRATNAALGLWTYPASFISFMLRNNLVRKLF
jgi:hypothetical protein